MLHGSVSLERIDATRFHFMRTGSKYLLFCFSAAKSPVSTNFMYSGHDGETMKSILRSAASPLVAANALALPLNLSPVQAAGASLLHADNIGSAPGCAAAKSPFAIADLQKFTAVRAAGGSGPQAPIKKCYACLNPLTEAWTWYFCMKISRDPQPAKCQLFTHNFTVFYCPDQTGYSCNGSNWESSGQDCTKAPMHLDCSTTNSPQLPPGCAPPVNQRWVLCDPSGK